MSGEDRLPDALHLCSLDCPEPCPHVWYPAFLPAALRVLSYDSGSQRDADAKVGWDYGPEQGAWLRALADALEARSKEHNDDDGLRARMEALADEFDAKGRRGSAHFGADIGDTIRLWIERDPRGECASTRPSM